MCTDKLRKPVPLSVGTDYYDSSICLALAANSKLSQNFDGPSIVIHTFVNVLLFSEQARTFRLICSKNPTTTFTFMRVY